MVPEKAPQTKAHLTEAFHGSESPRAPPRVRRWESHEKGLRGIPEAFLVLKEGTIST